MSDVIRQTLLFPLIQSVHLIGLTLLVGTISVVDLRLLGIAMRRRTVVEVVSGVAPWTLLGLVTVLVTGPLLFWSDIARYLSNPAFLVKMGLLAVALAAHASVHRSVVRTAAMIGERIPLRQKLAAVLSLLLWSSVVVAGRAIADFDIRPA